MIVAALIKVVLIATPCIIANVIAIHRNVKCIPTENSHPKVFRKSSIHKMEVCLIWSEILICFL